MSKLTLRFAFINSPTIKPIKIGITVKNPPAFGYFHPSANPTKTKGVIVNATFSHKEYSGFINGSGLP